MLLDSPSEPGQADVLICLDNPQVAKHIGSVLSARGLTVATVPVSGLDATFEQPGGQVVVTHTAMIGRVRSRLHLPVVNVEAFIFERPDHSTTGAPKQFDGPAFVKRVMTVMSDAERRRRGDGRAA
ncbi:hypothetical protein QD357_21005 [Rhizobium sp. BR 317]|uniref:hypothetical protein n=1 Tax=Rhizobium sp. BR 317 TaxID=3040015 RepID=UPI0039BF6001